MINAMDYVAWSRCECHQGKRGQAFLRELRQALDEMPEKKLIAHELEKEGAVCAIGALGALGVKRGVDMSALDPEDYSSVAHAFDIAAPLAQEIVYENDEAGWNETPEKRWERMSHWVDWALRQGDKKKRNKPKTA